MLLALWSTIAELANARHPLEPLDLSSPRATLNSFLTTGDTSYQQIRDEYWEAAPTRAADDHLYAINDSLQRMFDLSGIPPAARFDLGRDGIVYLYEVLSRIELPPEADIPDAAAYAIAEDGKEAAASADAEDGQKAGDKSISWTIPHTEITLVRVADGPHAGQFLFSTSTVLRAKEFYEKVRTLPYRRDVPMKNYAEMRPYLSIGGWIIAPRTIEGFPDWLKHSVYQQAVWKWIALAMLIAMAIVVIVVIHRLARRGLSGHTARDHLRRLATPLTLLLTSLVLDLANTQLSLTGWVSGSITWMVEGIKFFALAWFAWTGSMAVAEAFIASPKIPDQSLNAHLLRLVARTFGIVVAIVIILYVSNRLGAPLYGLIAGLGVGGVALALSAQPTIENFIGSLNLFADRPVRVGDFCRYGEDPTLDWQRIGYIESIGIRSTRIRGIDHTVTTIPNADFSKMQLVNYTVRRRMLLLTVLGLRYETTDDQLRFVLATLRDMLLAHPRVLDEEPRARFAGFGDFSLNVEIRVEINTSDFDEFRAIREDIYLRVMKIVKDAGTFFAFPSRTVYHTSDDGLDAERQQEAEAKVRAWCSAQELPFPRFSAEHRKKIRNTLDYPPEGSSEENE
jgi:MscS family membrane protein